MTPDLSGIEAIFIDDGGVMNDNERRGQQWLRFLAEYLVPRLGGDHAAWEAANLEVLKRTMPMFIEGTGFPLKGGFRKAERKMAIVGFRDMCEIVGVAAPDDDGECYGISRATTEYVIQRVRSDYPGAADAIRALHGGGYRLYTASGTYSFDIQVFLKGMGVSDLFTRTYGPDLIDTHKGSRHYYEGILADSGESPATSLFLDDSEKSIGWIVEAGARAILVSPVEQKSTDAIAVLGALSELPEFLARQRV